MKYICIIFCILFWSNSIASIKIDSINKSTSRCLNSGSITVFASSTSQIVYTVQTGSSISAPQSSPIFQNLAAGMYLVKVVNLTNEKDSILVTITGNYATPDFIQKVSSTTCSNNSDGIIIGTPTVNKGLKPYTWTLKNNISGAIITQSSDTFKNLPKSDYTLTMSDSCMNTTVHNFEVLNTVSELKINSINFLVLNCSSFKTYIYYSTFGIYKPNLIKYEYNGITTFKVPNNISSTYIEDTVFQKYIGTKDVLVTIYNQCGDSAKNLILGDIYPFAPILTEVKKCDTVTILFMGNKNFTAYQKAIFQTKNGTLIYNNINLSIFNYTFPNISYNDTINYKLISVCNDTLSGLYSVPGLKFDYKYSVNTILTNCNSKFEYIFERIKNLTSSSTTNYKLISVNTGIKLKDTTIHDMSRIIFRNYDSLQSYHVVMTNDCGEKDTITFFWSASISSKSVYKTFYMQDVCLDSVVSVSIGTQGFNGDMKLTNFSGPLTIKNTKLHYNYFDSFNYKYNYTKSGTSYFLTNLGVGKYYFRIADSCGFIDDSLEITTDHISNNFYSYQAVKSCQDNNKLILNLYSLHTTYLFNKMVFGTYSIFDIQNNKFLNNIPSKQFNYNSSNGFSITDTFKYLSEGKYILKINYTYSDYSTTSYEHLTYNQNCTQVIDTLIIPVYTRPNVKSIIKLNCNNLNQVVLNPDSSLGIAPYRYEINQGPQTYPIQSSQLFSINQLGNYQAKIWDTCGNANTTNFTVDTFKIDPVATNDTTCSNSSVVLAYEHSTYLNYRWERPNGLFYYGDTLRINPIKIGDVGVYKITKFVTINGCQDSFKTSYNLVKSKSHNRYDTIIEGDSIYFKPKYRKLSGQYIDTIHILPCDSFYILNLYVKDTNLYDTIYRHICFKDSMLFKGKFYKSSGTYYDTVDIANRPDSIHVLILTVNSSYPTFYRYDTILEGDSIYFNNKYISNIGMYRDTIHILPCDSFVVLNLFIKDTTIHDTTRKHICFGDSILYRGVFYRSSTLYNIFIDVIKKPDTLFTLILKVNPSKITTATSQDICNNYKLNNKIYFNDSLFIDTIKSILGCDSIINKNQFKVYKTTIQADSTISQCYVINYKNKNYFQSVSKIDSTQLKFKSLPSCDSLKRYISLIIKPRPALFITPSISNLVDRGAIITLTASGASSYIWNINESFTNKINYTAYQNKTFQLIGTAQNFCTDTISYRVLLKDSFYYTVTVPNAFSPNGDGNNDIMYLRLTGVKKLISFKIYNRLGQLIFYTTDENNGWDGYYKTAMQNTDVYFYSYQIETKDSKIKGGDGNFMLMR
jgi:gliding motility-associated-like protein